MRRGELTYPIPRVLRVKSNWGVGLGEAPEPSRERVQTCATRTTLYVSEGFLLDQKMTKMAPFAPGEGVASYPAQQNM